MALPESRLLPGVLEPVPDAALKSSGDYVEAQYLLALEPATRRMLSENFCAEVLWPRWLAVVREWLSFTWRHEPLRSDFAAYTDAERRWVIGPHGCDEDANEAWLVLCLGARHEAESRMLHANAARLAGHLLLLLGRVENPWLEKRTWRGEAAVLIADRRGRLVAKVAPSFVAAWTRLREEGLGAIETRRVAGVATPVCRWEGVWLHLRFVVLLASERVRPWAGVVETNGGPASDCRPGNVRLAPAARSQAARWSWNHDAPTEPRLCYKSYSREYREPLAGPAEEFGEARTWLRLVATRLEKPHLIHNVVGLEAQSPGSPVVQASTAST